MTSIREQYDVLGIDQYYLNHSDDYTNPHERDVVECLAQCYDENRHKAVFDFACGDGLVSKWIGDLSYIVGNDCYMKDRYINETGNKCYDCSFFDFINFNNTIEEKFDLTVISYALDLCNIDILPTLLYRLALISKELMIIRPNKHLIQSPYWSLSNTHTNRKSKASMYISNLS